MSDDWTLPASQWVSKGSQQRREMEQALANVQAQLSSVQAGQPYTPIKRLGTSLAFNSSPASSGSTAGGAWHDASTGDAAGSSAAPTATPPLSPATPKAAAAQEAPCGTAVAAAATPYLSPPTPTAAAEVSPHDEVSYSTTPPLLRILTSTAQTPSRSCMSDSAAGRSRPDIARGSDNCGSAAPVFQRLSLAEGGADIKAAAARSPVAGGPLAAAARVAAFPTDARPCPTQLSDTDSPHSTGGIAAAVRRPDAVATAVLQASPQSASTLSSASTTPRSSVSAHVTGPGFIAGSGGGSSRGRASAQNPALDRLVAANVDALCLGGAAAEQAARNIAALRSGDAVIAGALTEGGAAPPLVALLTGRPPGGAALAARALSALAATGQRCRATIVEAGAIGPLISQLQVRLFQLLGTEGQRFWALQVLLLSVACAAQLHFHKQYRQVGLGWLP